MRLRGGASRLPCRNCSVQIRLAALGVAASTEKFHEAVDHFAEYGDKAVAELEAANALIAAGSQEASANVQTVAAAAEELSNAIAEISAQVTQSTAVARDAAVQPPPQDQIEPLAETEQPTPLAQPFPCCGGPMLVIETFEPGHTPWHNAPRAPPAGKAPTAVALSSASAGFRPSCQTIHSRSATSGCELGLTSLILNPRCRTSGSFVRLPASPELLSYPSVLGVNGLRVFNCADTG